MKANAPEKIYIPTILAANPVKYKEEGSIEYVRKDAFIKKVCEYLMDYEFNDSPTIADRRKRVDEFKKYMKEE